MSNAASTTEPARASRDWLVHVVLVAGVVVFALPLWIVLMGSTHDAATIGRGDVPLLPGVATPTEAFTAFQLGCPTVKLFPAQALGPATLRALTEVLPGLGVVPTGGVSLVNAADWLGAGALAVGVGGALNTAYRTGGSAAVTELAEQLVERCPALATTGSGAAR